MERGQVPYLGDVFICVRVNSFNDGIERLNAGAAVLNQL